MQPPMHRRPICGDEPVELAVLPLSQVDGSEIAPVHDCPKTMEVSTSLRGHRQQSGMLSTAPRVC